MADERRHSTRPARLTVRNPQDLYGGLALVALALVALWESRALPGMQGIHFGPGTAPRLFAGLLALAGAALSLIGLLTRGPGVDRYAVRGPLLVTASVLVFAGTIRSLGLVVATFITILVAAAASPETRWRETVIWACLITLFCTLLFPYALNLPLQLWPRF